MTDKPTGVFVRLPLKGEQLSKFQNFRNGGCEADTVMRAIGTPVQDEDFNQSRECFEVFYAEMCTKATGCSGVTTDYVRGLRCGDNYGGRAFLNNIWEAWPDFVAHITPLLAARDAEIARLNEELSVYRARMSELIAKEIAALKGGAV